MPDQAVHKDHKGWQEVLAQRDQSAQQVPSGLLDNKASKAMLEQSERRGRKVSEDPLERLDPLACRVLRGQADWPVQQGFRGRRDKLGRKAMSGLQGRAERKASREQPESARRARQEKSDRKGQLARRDKATSMRPHRRPHFSLATGARR